MRVFLLWSAFAFLGDIFVTSFWVISVSVWPRSGCEGGGETKRDEINLSAGCCRCKREEDQQLPNLIKWRHICYIVKGDQDKDHRKEVTPK